MFVVSMALCATALAQVTQQSSGPNSPNINGVGSATVTKDLAVRSSPAEDSLVQLSEQMTTTNKALNDLLQQARANLDTKDKPIIDEIKARSKKWQDKIDADTKDLKAQLDKNEADAKAKFQQETAELNSKNVSPQTISALEGVVRQEQNLPATAHYDPQQHKWVDLGKK